MREAVTLLVPPAWQNDPRIDDEERAMHRYHAMLAEPWDGPAGLVFTDGVACGAALDRNGLRPLRVAVCDDGLVAVSSEAGAMPLPDGVGRAAGAARSRASSSRSIPSAAFSSTAS